MRYNQLAVGEPAPWFNLPTASVPEFQFHTVAGRYVVLCFAGSFRNELAQRALRAVFERRKIFNDTNVSFFGVTLDQADEQGGPVRDRLPGIRFFLDHAGEVSRLYGALPLDCDFATAVTRSRPLWLVLDPLLRVAAVIPFKLDGSDIEELSQHLTQLPPPDRYAGFPVQAPVLVLPRVFDEQLCDNLIQAYEAGAQMPSGVMQQAGAMTVPVHKPDFKVRTDHVLQDQALIAATRTCIARRVLPEIARALQFKATRMERFIVACYPAEGGGHFNAHRDNTTKATAHRRFAVSINLNDDFAGGEIGFPEYGAATFKPGRGAAVVFSCGLLHSVSTVTQGRRYAFLPFLYDEEAAGIRDANAKFLVSSYEDAPAAVL